jgi:drug/metabolite transporter (DMT)-like permease
MINAVILLSVLFSSMAQVSLKWGMLNFSRTLDPVLQGSLGGLFWVATNPFILTGVGLHLLALITWLYVLKHVDVSYAYPFIALGFVLVLLVSHWLFGEAINRYRVAGIFCIFFGLYLISRSAA